MSRALVGFRRRVGWLLLRHYRYEALSLERPVSVSRAEKIALLWGPSFEVAAVETLQDVLVRDRKKVMLLAYAPKDTRLPAGASVVRLGPQDLDFWRRPRRSRLTKFLKQRFDVLINLDRENIFALDYLAAVARAAMKIGIGRRSDPAIYDVIFDLPPAMRSDVAVEQLLHYLQNIEKS